MRTDILSFILGSGNRRRLVKTLLEYPKRQWTCSALEDLTKISHATVFRTLNGLRDFGILKSIKINKKDIIYELMSSPLTKEIERILNIEKIAAKRIAKDFVSKIKLDKIYSAILYGSSIKGNLRLESDIDILIVLNKHNEIIEKSIFNKAAELSSKFNRTISIIILDLQEVKKERNGQFIKSLKENMEVIYGKKPF